MKCTCGHDHDGCCAMPKHEQVHEKDARCTCAPCSGDVVGLLETSEDGSPWRRLYCAGHWPEFKGRAPEFDLTVTELTEGS